MSKSPIIEKMREQMAKDKWHVKLRRWARVQYWLFYCLLFNNKYVRKFKQNREMKNDKLIEIIKEAEQKLQQPNKKIDSYRCYWEGRLSLVKELLEAEQESKQSAEEILKDELSDNLWNLICTTPIAYRSKEMLKDWIIQAMEEHSNINCDKIHNLFNKPAEKLRPLEDLYRAENPDPEGRFYIPDRTAFYKWIAKTVQEYKSSGVREELIKFAQQFYSDKETCIHNVNNYLKAVRDNKL